MKHFDSRNLPSLAQILIDKTHSFDEIFDKDEKAYNEIRVMMACVVLSTPMKKLLNISLIRDAYDPLYKTVYKFTLKILKNLLSLPAFKSIFNKAYENGIIKEKVKEASDYKIYKDLYEQKAIEMYKITCSDERR
jgi:hypothetical protein